LRASSLLFGLLVLVLVLVLVLADVRR